MPGQISRDDSRQIVSLPCHCKQSIALPQALDRMVTQLWQSGQVLIPQMLQSSEQNSALA